MSLFFLTVFCIL